MHSLAQIFFGHLSFHSDENEIRILCEALLEVIFKFREASTGEKPHPNPTTEEMYFPLNVVL